GFGYVRSGDGPIAAWGQSTSAMTHACISGVGHGPRWESKCGSDLRIQHGLNELVGASYGRVVAFYRRNSLLLAEFETLLETTVKTKKQRMTLSPAEKKLLAAQAKEVPADVRARFEKAFESWKAGWFEGGLAISSVPQTRAVGAAFDTLIALGPQ